ncbi:MAG: DUF411 domain-containing protein [Bryobacteraceae bacterium]
MNRKQFLGVLAGVPIAALVRMQAAAPHVHVYKTPTCGCCGNWVEHLKKNGFEVSVENVPDTTPYRRKYGIPDSVMSCHTGVVGGYALEGHVPAAEVQRLLREKPKAKGLAVPGMPMGSPGMEAATTQAYSVMLIDAMGQASVYQKYPRKG